MPSRWLRLAVAAAAALATAVPASAQTPSTTAPIAFTRDTAIWLATLPLGCIDKLHDPPKSRGYVFESAITLKPDFQKSRAFYGCFDWHSSVNSTWTLVKILRTYPDLPVARLIREKLNAHLSEDAIKGDAQLSITSMYDASYEGTHWIATYIVDYLISQRRRPAAATQQHQ